MKRWWGMIFLGTFITVTPVPLLAAPPPQIILEAPDSLLPLATRLKSLHPQIFQDIMKLVGLDRSGPPLRIILAREDSPLAQQAPPWAAGYALSPASTIVILAERITPYPFGSFEGVLTHEIAHILIHRAAGGHPLPRWFDEGLAMIAARRWDFEDRARLIWAMVSKTTISLEELNALFLQDSASANRAYVLAHAMTLDVIDHAPPDFLKQLLARVKLGLPFQEAFAQTSGKTLRAAEEQFWSGHTFWNRWIPVITSSAMLWFTITFLAFWAYSKQRKRTAMIKRQWKDDEWDRFE